MSNIITALKTGDEYDLQRKLLYVLKVTVSSCSRAGKIEYLEEKWGIHTLSIRRLRFLTITIYDAVLNTPMKVEI